MAISSMPHFESTPLDEISNIVKLLPATRILGTTRPLEYLIAQLHRLYWAINDHEEAICKACKLDLGRSSHETSLIEVDWLRNDIVFTTQNLERWMADESAPDIPLMNLPLRPKTRKEP
jgi:beta-apo-4'-carotenal oxygenase